MMAQGKKRASPLPHQEMGKGSHQPAEAQQAASAKGSEAANKSASLVRDSEITALQAMLWLEGQCREAASVEELSFVITNETHKVLRSRQVFVVDVLAGRRKPVVKAITSLATLDRNVPFVQWIERILARLFADGDIAKQMSFQLTAYSDGDQDQTPYPFSHALWLPFCDREGRTFAGMLLTREGVWTEGDGVVAERLADCYRHAYGALVQPQNLIRRKKVVTRGATLVGVGVLLAAFIPVPMTALAPIEVVAKNPQVIHAPIDGFIKDIVVPSNSQVRQGAVLVQLNDVDARNDVEITKKKVRVAQAHLMKVNNAAFEEAESRHELGIARTELALRRAEYQYAVDRYKMTELQAPSDGVVTYADKSKLIGRPVSVGDRIMEVVNPAETKIEIRLSVSDAIVLQGDGHVRVFFDEDPLNPRDGKLTNTNYHAETGEDGVLHYRLWAELSDDTDTPPRLGVRGTAQVFSEPVPLAFYLFRRPISALRQWIGL